MVTVGNSEPPIAPAEVGNIPRARCPLEAAEPLGCGSMEPEAGTSGTGRWGDACVSRGSHIHACIGGHRVGQQPHSTRRLRLLVPCTCLLVPCSYVLCASYCPVRLLHAYCTLHRCIGRCPMRFAAFVPSRQHASRGWSTCVRRGQAPPQATFLTRQAASASSMTARETT